MLPFGLFDFGLKFKYYVCKAWSWFIIKDNSRSQIQSKYRLCLKSEFRNRVGRKIHKVSTNDRCQKKGVIATSLDDLLDKTASAFLLSFQFLTLVLESDGTTVDTEEFFQSLPANTPFIVLERGQRWTKAPDDQDCKKPRKNGMAKLSFHLYKLHPKDFLGCLIIKARLCEMYTLSYDIRAFLRCLAYMVSLTGHLLQFGSSYVLQYMGEDEYQSSNTQQQPFCLDSAS
ncbi:cell death activator CIDE-A-like isoform X2 [Anguilla anguilla]|uniref:cell death activator CIDE-A-like isoform X2 n=1 Tax=Anguilla anguilla TaxID=7936 RepID=UPI0015B12CB5|nr:cell death activator CIDE-A-like isoform X2 [Anguilla anguilla]